MMNRSKTPLALACLLSFSCLTQAEEPQGPFPVDQWPTSADPDATVHFVSVGDAFFSLGENWITGNMQILRGGPGSDQTTQDITIGGFQGLKVTGDFLNIADNDYPEWADDEEIDILMQVYGDGALFNSSGEVRDFNFLIGTLPDLDFPVGGQIPLEARNRKWNWVLFRIPNSIRESDGSRRVGSVPEGAQGQTDAGGVNGGTIRMQNVPNLIVRAVAFGEKGAFGEPEQINQFEPADECPPEPETNLAWIDFASEQSANMELLNDKDQTIEIYESIGPVDEPRRAAVAIGNYMNFAVTDNYLGLPCNEPVTMKVCVEYYDDPFLLGVGFGPEAYATDDQGGIGFFPQDQRVVLQGSGEWRQHSWIVPGVNLYGVNTAPLTAGPRLYFDSGYSVFISKYSLAVLRSGNHPLAGEDPLAECISDPNFCAGVYGTYAEFDLSTGLLDGLEPGTSVNDQEMIQEEAGPASDRRLAVRPAFDDGSTNYNHNFLNFAITGEKLGPSSQPGVQLAICVTYYDDPALAGATFRPEVYQSDEGGDLGLEFSSPNIAVTLEGTDTWREAYFELPNVKFLGVNQGPQAAARFTLSDKIFLSRVRYGVIRPCGPEAGVNPLEECKPAEPVAVTPSRNSDGTVRIAWPVAAGSFVLEETSEASPASWTPVAETPVVEGEENVLTVTPEGRRFYRLSESLPE